MQRLTRSWAAGAVHASRCYQIPKEIAVFQRKHVTGQRFDPNPGSFVTRHIGPTPMDEQLMLNSLGFEDQQDFLAAVYAPLGINKLHLKSSLNLTWLNEHGCSEAVLEDIMEDIAKDNVGQHYKSLLGQGFHNCFMPAVIRRHLLENPRWYTPYTPYQAEISQGRLEMLYHFQTMICSLTAMPIANASLLDEASAAAEAMLMAFRLYNQRQGKQRGHGTPLFMIQEDCHPQVISVIKGRAVHHDIEVRSFSLDQALADPSKLTEIGAFGILFQYPGTHGMLPHFPSLKQLMSLVRKINPGCSTICGVDLLSLAILVPPGELEADICIGTTQRFGLPLGNGGPHAGFMAAQAPFMRLMPGRIVGRQQANRRFVYRLSLQTREQHIKRERATSNICTSQALPANLAAAYAIYNGPKEIVKSSCRIQRFAHFLQEQLKAFKAENTRFTNSHVFDTVSLVTPLARQWQEHMSACHRINIRRKDDLISISLDDTVSRQDLLCILSSFSIVHNRAHVDPQDDLKVPEATNYEEAIDPLLPSSYLRISAILDDPVFNSYHNETKFMRYIYSLCERDYSLVDGAIPLGSCSMKLNSAAHLGFLSQNAWMNVHPFSPKVQRAGYTFMNQHLLRILTELTGMDSGTLQPNSGAQAEFTGVSMVKAYFTASNGKASRSKCLIPVTAHGTNAATASLCGYQVLPVPSRRSDGTLDQAKLVELVEKHGEDIAFLMITIPSTYGIFEKGIIDESLWNALKKYDIQIYLDGANLNALVGYLRPGCSPTRSEEKDIGFGADMIHVNCHKTFCIPHGGGGPGMAPLLCRKHLAPFLPRGEKEQEGDLSIEAVASAPSSSNSLLTIPYAYLLSMGQAGLRRATYTAILSSNYVAKLLASYYKISFVKDATADARKLTAHEFIIDLQDAPNGITATDVAKRLMNYNVHAPTVSWPLPQSLMVEITESETMDEIQRLIKAFIFIADEIKNKPQLVLQAPWTVDNVATLPEESRGLALAPWRHRGIEHYIAKEMSPCGRINEAQCDRQLLETCSTCN